VGKQREPIEGWLRWSLVNYSLFAVGGIAFVILGLVRGHVGATVVGAAMTILCAVASIRMRRHPRWHWMSY
jgi:hypothetical protein